MDFNNIPMAQATPWEIPERIFVIAEVGINHNGDIGLAKQLIDMAVEAGCDAVKFQKRTIEIVYDEDMLNSPRESPWGTTQREQKEGLEFGKAEYDEIDAYCRAKGIEWFASAWDIPSQEFLRDYGCKYNKVASAMLTHTDFLKAVASEKKPTFISTGMSTFDDIDRAVEIFKAAGCPYMLMHTVSTYPCPEDTLNLRMLNTLRERYKCPVGYSGHEPSVSPSFVAAVMGASAIERHVTIDRAMYGSDQAASLEKSGLQSLLAQIRKLPGILGNGEKTFGDGERSVAQKLRYWE
jgi:N-acetylneuraminate synthase